MTRKHIEALDELDQMRAAGQVSEAQYSVHRANLLADAAKPRKTWTFVILAVGVLVLILLAGFM